MKKLNIVLPISGSGQRFVEKHYQDPKPLIYVKNLRMIELVLKNINYTQANYIFIVRQEHLDNYNLKEILERNTNNPTIIPVSKTTEGAACSCLLAKNYINNYNPLFIINGDQYIEMDFSQYFNEMFESNSDGSIITFPTENDKKWSYVSLNENGFINEVREKEPFSNLATVGAYYWSKGVDFVNSAEEMIKLKLKTNSEYYLAPSYNQLVNKNKKIIPYIISKDQFHGIGTPEDLEKFISNNII